MPARKTCPLPNLWLIPFTFITKMLYPLALPLVKSTKFIEKRLEKRSSYLSIQDIKEAIDLTSKQEQNPGAGNILTKYCELRERVCQANYDIEGKCGRL
jgi:hypothetical protein